MWASENGNVEMVEFLLKKEADPNLATKVRVCFSLMIMYSGHCTVVSMVMYTDYT